MSKNGTFGDWLCSTISECEIKDGVKMNQFNFGTDFSKWPIEIIYQVGNTIHVSGQKNDSIYRTLSFMDFLRLYLKTQLIHLQSPKKSVNLALEILDLLAEHLQHFILMQRNQGKVLFDLYTWISNDEEIIFNLESLTKKSHAFKTYIPLSAGKYENDISEHLSHQLLGHWNENNSSFIQHSFIQFLCKISMATDASITHIRTDSSKLKKKLGIIRGLLIKVYKVQIHAAILFETLGEDVLAMRFYESGLRISTTFKDKRDSFGHYCVDTILYKLSYLYQKMQAPVKQVNVYDRLIRSAKNTVLAKQYVSNSAISTLKQYTNKKSDADISKRRLSDTQNTTTNSNMHEANDPLPQLSGYVEISSSDPGEVNNQIYALFSFLKANMSDTSIENKTLLSQLDLCSQKIDHLYLSEKNMANVSILNYELSGLYIRFYLRCQKRETEPKKRIEFIRRACEWQSYQIDIAKHSFDPDHEKVTLCISNLNKLKLAEKKLIDNSEPDNASLADYATIRPGAQVLNQDMQSKMQHFIFGFPRQKNNASQKSDNDYIDITFNTAEKRRFNQEKIKQEINLGKGFQI